MQSNLQHVGAGMTDDRPAVSVHHHDYELVEVHLMPETSFFHKLFGGLLAIDAQCCKQRCANTQAMFIEECTVCGEPNPQPRIEHAVEHCRECGKTTGQLDIHAAFTDDWTFNIHPSIDPQGNSKSRERRAREKANGLPTPINV